MKNQLKIAIDTNMESAKEMIDDFVSWCKKNKFPIDSISYEIYFRKLE